MKITKSQEMFIKKLEKYHEIEKLAEKSHRRKTRAEGKDSETLSLIASLSSDPDLVKIMNSLRRNALYQRKICSLTERKLKKLPFSKVEQKEIVGFGPGIREEFIRAFSSTCRLIRNNEELVESTAVVAETVPPDEILSFADPANFSAFEKEIIKHLGITNDQYSQEFQYLCENSNMNKRKSILQSIGQGNFIQELDAFEAKVITAAKTHLETPQELAKKGILSFGGDGGGAIVGSVNLVANIAFFGYTYLTTDFSGSSTGTTSEPGLTSAIVGTTTVAGTISVGVSGSLVNL